MSKRYVLSHFVHDSGEPLEAYVIIGVFASIEAATARAERHSDNADLRWLTASRCAPWLMSAAPNDDEIYRIDVT
jgi:hypothetical protein